MTALNEKGIPTPLVHTMLRAPGSRMDVLSEQEIQELTNNSELIDYYNESIDKESAADLLQDRYKAIEEEQPEQEPTRRSGKSTIEKVLDNSVTRQVGRTVARELTRGILGIFGIKTTARRRTKSWF